MFAGPRYSSPKRLLAVLGLAVIGLVLAPSPSGAASLDIVTVTSSPSGLYPHLSVEAHSGTSGQSPSGFFSNITPGFGGINGPVTCLSVTGPDQGAGTLTSPTTAVLNVDFLGSIVTVQFVDYGGGGNDRFGFSFENRAPSDCSPSQVFPGAQLGLRAVVNDAPVLPTSKDQCKTGGWQTFSQFQNQGDCVSFVATKGKNQPG